MSNNTTPYPTFTLLVTDSKWSFVLASDPATGPCIWSIRVTFISSVHKNTEKSVFRYFLAQAYLFNLCSVMVTFQRTLPSPCLWALNTSSTSGGLQFGNTGVPMDNGFLEASHSVFGNIWQLICFFFSAHFLQAY